MTKRGEPMAWLLAVLTTMPTECTAWKYGRTKGYGAIEIDGRPSRAHIAVCTWYHGPRPPGQQVRHLCGNGHLGCFTPSHLRWGTPAEDGADRVAVGRQATAIRSRARLTQALADEMRARHASEGIGKHRLAAEYGVGVSTVRDVLQNKTWRPNP